MKRNLFLAAAFSLLVLIPHGTQAAGPTVTVNSDATLASAIKTATSGETIMLAYGTYTRPLFSNANFTSPVTITSVDPAHQAIIAGLAVASSSNLIFKGLEFSTVGSPDAYYAFRITSSTNITFTDLDVRGNLSIAPGSELNAFLLQDSNGVAITDSQFQYLNSAITAGADTNITISGNTINFVSKGGVEMGGCSFVKITDNKFSNFETSAGTHGDAVQLFTTGTKSAGHDITITGNVYTRGTGVPTQGIFIQDELGTFPYYNMVIDNNAMIGGDWNSIYLEHATGNIEVNNNITASWLGANVVSGGNTNFIGWIFLRGDYTGAHVTETGNKAQAFLIGTTTLAKPPAGNTLIGPVTDNGAALIASLSATTPVNVGTASTTPPVSSTTPHIPVTSTSGGPATASSTAASLKPVVTMSVTPARMVHGGSATITWSSTNSVSCVGTNEDNPQSAWNSKLPPAGTFVESNMLGGQHFFLTCINAYGKGGSSYLWVGVPAATATTTKTSLTASVYNALSNAFYNLEKLFGF